MAGNDWQGVAAYYNATSATKVWRPDAPKADVAGAVDWKNTTVSEAPPTGPASVTDGTAHNYANRCLQCQGFAMTITNMLLLFGATVPGDQSKVRQGFQDALSAIPSGTNGAVQDAGWTAVRLALTRLGTRLEILFSSADGFANKSTLYGTTVDGNDCYLAFTS